MVELIKDGVVKIKADTDKVGINRLKSEGYELANNEPLSIKSTKDGTASADLHESVEEGHLSDAGIGGKASEEIKAEPKPAPKPSHNKQGKKRR
jgi:hypothetical protein